MISLNKAEIEALIDLPTAARAIEDAHRATSRGEVTLPPVGHITFPDFDGDCHIKYGHVQGNESFVIKIATGFPENAERGLPTGNGMSLVLSARTGAVQAKLHDEMVMTDVRTGLAGAIATRALAREGSKRFTVVGTGPQAYRQIESHAALLGGDIDVAVWGRSRAKALALVEQAQDLCNVWLCDDLEAAVQEADVVVTATGATQPIIQDDWVQPGTHITAVGADAPGKQELDAKLVARADVVVADLVAQCLDHGEICHAARNGQLDPGRVLELGDVLAVPHLGRSDDSQITLADLTGIAAQDIAMAQVVLSAWEASQP